LYGLVGKRCANQNIWGGLGIKDLELYNYALLGKWVWGIRKEKDKLWAKVLCSKYNVGVDNWRLEVG